MKRLIALLLSIIMVLTGCGQAQTQTIQPSDTSTQIEVTEPATTPFVWEDVVPQYDSLDDAELLAHVEDLVYRDTVASLNTDEYVVESVSAVYISKEYLDEIAFNSQSNIYFGYTLAELDKIFQGTKYIFTLGDDGTTTVQELQVIEDVYSETMLKNVAIGTGVILVCVTVSVVTAGAGAPAVSMIFAASAKNATTFAVSSAAFGGISAGVVKGIQTGDFNEAMDVAAMGASEGFKWGAISGAVVGGGKEAFLLKAGTKGGLTMNQVAIIQKESHYPVEVITRFNSMEQYEICKSAGLTAKMVNGKTALVRQIDLNYVDELTGKTNLQLMQEGYAPYDPTGQKYQLHHIGQRNDSPLAILTQAEHTGSGNDKIWHILTDGFDNPSKQLGWTKIKQDFWQNYAKQAVSGGV